MRVNVLKKILYFIALLSLMALACFSQVLSDNEKIKVFYKYDGMFFYGNKEKESPVEKGNKNEIFEIDKITHNYKNIVESYLDIITQFINSNMVLLQSFYKGATNPDMNKETSMKIYNDVLKSLKDKLLPSLPGAIRCMIAVEDIQYIEVSIRLDNDKYASTVNPGNVDQVIWTDILYGAPTSPFLKKDIIDKYGAIKYHEWFYESNMKIRVVKQIRDKDGKYYGEIYADYYKLDQYDKLFDKDGNPKKTNDK